MEPNEVRIRNRERAYKYIRTVVNNRVSPSKDISIISDTDLADVLDGIFGLKDDLRLLRAGKSDPSRRLIEAFRNFVGPTVPEFEIDSYLVTPFFN